MRKGRKYSLYKFDERTFGTIWGKLREILRSRSLITLDEFEEIMMGFREAHTWGPARAAYGRIYGLMKRGAWTAKDQRAFVRMNGALWADMQRFAASPAGTKFLGRMKMDVAGEMERLSK